MLVIIDGRDILEMMSLNAVRITEIHCGKSNAGGKILSILKHLTLILIT
jgi:hypothetical protein